MTHKKHPTNYRQTWWYKLLYTKIFEYELKEHHWPLIIASSLSIALIIIASYFSNVLAYNASDILGQHDRNNAITYTQDQIYGGAITAHGFYGPMSVLLDTNDHRLFVADYSNRRVLIFNLDENNNLIGYNANYVLGQPTLFSTPDSTVNSSTLATPSALGYDPTRKLLFVSDYGHNRIMVFDLNNGISDGMNAAYVLGQTNLYTNSTTTNANTLYGPMGLFYDNVSNTLYISEALNNRITVFDVNAIENGEAAIDVIGQTDFNSRSSGTSDTKLSAPRNITVANNTLFVADTSNNRILGFGLNDQHLPTDKIADLVLGQDNFTSSTSGITDSKLSSPYHVAYSATQNKLFVSDTSNDRLLAYDNSDGLTNGEAAINVLGQPDFTTNLAVGPSVNTLRSPRGLYIDEANQKIFASDNGNNRIIIYDISNINNGQDALGVIGQINESSQPEYQMGWANSSIPGKGLYGPRGVQIDSTHHRLFVGEEGAHRILVFELDNDNNLIDKQADYVIGKPNFYNNEMGTTASVSNLGAVRDISLDEIDNRLFVCDNTNNRIMIYDLNSLSSGMEANGVIGQINYTSSTAVTSQTGLSGPRGVYYEPTNKYLYVGDYGNHRVLVFDLSNGITSTASYVFGQTDFTSKTYSAAANKLKYPISISYNSSTKQLYVGDYGYNRILIYDLTNGITGNGMSATKVLGQPDFSTVSVGTTQSKMSSPYSTVLGSNTNTLYVSDQNNARILVYNIASIANGENAEAVLGQDDFTSVQYRTTQDGMMNFPGQIDFDRGNHRLYQTDANNNRVLIYNLPRVRHAAMPIALIGRAYSGNLAENGQYASGGGMTSGILPPGLELIGPTVFGIPTALGSYTFHMSISDALVDEPFYGDAGQLYDDGDITIEVTEPLNDWHYRKKITINSDKVTSTVTNFPLLIHLKTDTDLVNRALTNGQDIVFLPTTENWSTGYVNSLYQHRITNYNPTTGELTAWVNIPNLEPASTTEFYLYYGNPSAVDLQYSGEQPTSSDSNWNTLYAENQNIPEDFFTVSPELTTSSIDLSNWPYRKQITIHSEYVTTSVANFPVHLNLNSDNDLMLKGKSDGSDILFVPVNFSWSENNIDSRYQFEITSYSSSTGALEAYINLPHLNSSEDASFYLYYGNSSTLPTLTDANTQNGAATTTQSSTAWEQTVENNNLTGFYTLGAEELWQQDQFHLEVTGSHEQVLGDAQVVTLTLKNSSSSTVTNYNGEKSFTFFGASADGDDNHPTCSDKNNNDIAFGDNTLLNFVNGTATCTLKLYESETAHIYANNEFFSGPDNIAYSLEVRVGSAVQLIAPSSGSRPGILDEVFVNDRAITVKSRYIQLHFVPSKKASGFAVSNEGSFSNINVQPYQETADWVLSPEDGIKNIYTKFWYEQNGNSDPILTRVVLDTKVKITTPVAGEKNITTPFTVTGNSNSEAVVGINIGGTTYETKADKKGVFSVDILDQLPDGEYQITAWQYDKNKELGSSVSQKIIISGNKIENKKPNDKPEQQKPDEQKSEEGQNPNNSNIAAAAIELSSNMTMAEREETRKEIQNKSAFLLVLKQNSTNFAKDQATDITVTDNEQIQIVIRPKKEVHSIVGRLYKITDNQIAGNWYQKIKDYFLPSANAKITRELVDAYIFEHNQLDNIFSLSVNAPQKNGERYELVININNEDGTRVNIDKKITSAKTGVISSDGKPVTYARIEVQKYSQETNLYQTWAGELFGSENPIFSNKNGEYAVSLPAGQYHLLISAPGYEDYTSKIFVLPESDIINQDFTLVKTNFGWWNKLTGWLK